jgi:hypothetical protein
MSKKLNNLWFLNEPFDTEQKEYILLDFLKNKTKDLNQDTCLSTIKEISSLIKALKNFRDKKGLDLYRSRLNRQDKKIIEEFKDKTISEEDTESLNSIIEKSLQILYDYSEICMEMLKEEESKIKIFKIESKFREEKEKSDFGFLVMRNMITDDLLNYFYKSKIKMKTADGEKEIVILKKIHIKNPFFSMSYEHIYHEILENFGVINSGFPEFYVVEIYENFDEESEIFSISKDKFFEFITSEQNKKASQ